MCGIGGVVRSGERPISQWQIEMLACSLEHRGNDATGIAVQFADGSLEVMKDHDQAWKFMARKDTSEWLAAQLAKPEHRVVLVHTRKWTKGTCFENKNNHPMYAGASAIIHNGVITNDDQLFSTMDLKRAAETDSDIIRAIVDKYGLERKLLGKDGKLNKMVGSVASAILHPKYPGRLLLLRSNNPLYIGTNQEHMCFASTKRSCFLVLRQWVKRWGFEQTVHDNQLAFVSMPNHSGWLLDTEKKELAWHDEFNSSNYHRQITYNVHNTDWKRRREEAERAYDTAKAAEEKRRQEVANRPLVHRPELNIVSGNTVRTRPAQRRADFVVCPGKQAVSGARCATVLDCRSLPTDKPIWKMKCPTCSINLAEAKGCDAEGNLVN